MHGARLALVNMLYIFSTCSDKNKFIPTQYMYNPIYMFGTIVCLSEAMHISIRLICCDL